jgi:LysR family hydrogen peroxide-inducible transcriptional activator
MDLRQLAAVAAVAEQGSFSGAARVLNTVQSNVSTHVARLETELGVTLIDRTTGRPTLEGELVIQRARHIQAEIDALQFDVASLEDEVHGLVRAGVIGTTGRWLVPRLLEAMADEHPRVHVVMRDATTSSLLPQVAQGELDLAVVNLPISDTDVRARPLFDEDRIVVAPVDHPLARYERVHLDDLAAHPLLLEPAGTAFRDELDAEAAGAGVTLVAQAEVDGMRLLASLAFEGFGAALLPATAAPLFNSGNWKVVTLDGISQRSVGLIQRRRGLLSAPAQALHDTLLQVVKDEAPHQPGLHLA